ncbi:hypothetical protein CWATWH0402_3241 [Crocosphaera watsonii WH 0402]|uniref:Uncharacterized protein n=3 Tax=Crocosphaera watsonii TaxID=263511 RepID=T2JX39_CROWT|nr:hypothetical protein CWATWH0003_4872 [Crocosphaera watsonii WH 0003]CCQ56629.1 hypothetical protein CWATWH0005_26 [Crocosphaera watsonii WH 0005]CCQ69596.1 hypothetical protein CWATWH0402_3241 [Crocosphaera watsonii WH 0402]
MRQGGGRGGRVGRKNIIYCLIPSTPPYFINFFSLTYAVLRPPRPD